MPRPGFLKKEKLKSSGHSGLGKSHSKAGEIGIGTDGSASNNSLSLFDEMKLCALSAKMQASDPTAGKAEDIFAAATINGANIMGIDAGVIEVGKLADCMLVNLNNPLMFPAYNSISNLVYGADSSIVDTVICNGKIIMNNRSLPMESEIMVQAKAALQRIN